MEGRIKSLRREYDATEGRVRFLERDGHFDIAQQLRIRQQRILRCLARMASRWPSSADSRALNGVTTRRRLFWDAIRQYEQNAS